MSSVQVSAKCSLLGQMLVTRQQWSVR